MGQRQLVERTVGRELDGMDRSRPDTEQEGGENANGPVAQCPIPLSERWNLLRGRIITWGQLRDKASEKAASCRQLLPVGRKYPTRGIITI